MARFAIFPLESSREVFGRNRPFVVQGQQPGVESRVAYLAPGQFAPLHRPLQEGFFDGVGWR